VERRMLDCGRVQARMTADAAQGSTYVTLASDAKLGPCGERVASAVDAQGHGRARTGAHLQCELFVQKCLELCIPQISVVDDEDFTDSRSRGRIWRGRRHAQVWSQPLATVAHRAARRGQCILSPRRCALRALLGPASARLIALWGRPPKQRALQPLCLLFGHEDAEKIRWHDASAPLLVCC